jgi:hypothetical protein
MVLHVVWENQNGMGRGLLATFVIYRAITGEREGVWPGWGNGTIKDSVGIGTEIDVGAPVETMPILSKTYLSMTAFSEKNLPEVRHSLMKGVGGKISNWNKLDWQQGVCQLLWWRIDGGLTSLTFYKAMNAISSMVFEISLYACVISQLEVLTACHRIKHIPHCGLLDLCLSNGWRLLFSYS